MPPTTAKMKVDDLDYASMKWRLKKLFMIRPDAHEIGQEGKDSDTYINSEEVKYAVEHRQGHTCINF